MSNTTVSLQISHTSITIYHYSRVEPHGSGVFVLRARMAGVTPRGLPPGRAQGRVEGLVNAFERIQQGLAPDEVRLRAPGGPGEQVWSGHSRSERPRGRGRPSAGHFSARAARSWWGSSGRAAPFCRRRPLHIPRLKPPGVVHSPGGVPEKIAQALFMPVRHWRLTPCPRARASPLCT